MEDAFLAEYSWLAQKVAAHAERKKAKLAAPCKDKVEEHADGDVSADDLDEIVADVLDEEDIENIFESLARMR